MKNIILSALLLGFGAVSLAQGPGDDVRRFRIGLKAGVPNIIGGNAEFVLPVLGNRLAPFVDYSTFSLEVEEVDTSFDFFEIGSNIYFNTQGTGLYASVSYGKFNLDGTYTDAETIDGELFEGEATGEVEISTFNLKVGAKLGRKFYFRAEAGYGFGDIPQEVVLRGTVNGQPAEGREEIPDVPGIGDNGLLVANIGFGFAF
ncbi:hypothetical protein [Robiginitalea marina]|uniref:Outer membrane protein beta-barrel domain-containing protein n=1 Tax=Robiginitalea marina TaxID=2954105 RepID=A0ABT1AXJ6_9FLAO|nr:hypothetical protein [Robiginitalea marina]MCO5724644.1 hypothetical protein [Robiginitalea marina]